MVKRLVELTPRGGALRFRLSLAVLYWKAGQRRQAVRLAVTSKEMVK